MEAIGAQPPGAVPFMLQSAAAIQRVRWEKGRLHTAAARLAAMSELVAAHGQDPGQAERGTQDTAQEGAPQKEAVSSQGPGGGAPGSGCRLRSACWFPLSCALSKEYGGAVAGVRVHGGGPGRVRGPPAVGVSHPLLYPPAQVLCCFRSHPLAPQTLPQRPSPLVSLHSNPRPITSTFAPFGYNSSTPSAILLLVAESRRVQKLGKSWDVFFFLAPVCRCSLGDLRDDVECYQKPWEVSKGRFGRA